jgi:uncharacterized protein (DUF2141 family)
VLAALALTLHPANVRAQSSAPASSATAQRATLDVVISGLRNSKGQVIIWLWCGPDGFPRVSAKAYKAIAIDARTAVNGSVTSQVTVPPGEYAITVLHDENRNGKLDTDFLGIPTEGFGASNNVSSMGPPSFDQARFTVGNAHAMVSIALRYF